MKRMAVVMSMAWCVMAGTVVLAATPTADDLVARWAKASGGVEHIAKLENVYMKYKVFAAGMEGVVESWSTRQGQSRQELLLGGIYSNQTIFDGQGGWTVDHNGKVQAMEGVALRNAMTEAYLASMSHFVKGRRSGTMESLGLDSSGACYRLKVSPDGGKPVTVFLDAKTYEWVRQEREADDRTEVTTYSDLREVEGVRFPGRILVSTGDPQYDTRLEAIEIRTNVELPAGAFDQPSEGANDYKFTTGKAALRIPFELNSNHIYVKASVNGSAPLWFIFDTGAGVTVMDRARAEALKLPLEGKLEGRGAGEGSVEVSIIPKASFSLPGVELVDQTIMAIPLAMISPYEGRPVDGVLGYDLISRFVVKIDYAARTIDLLEKSDFNYTGSGERVPVVMEDNHPHVSADVVVGGRTVKGHFLIDTGARTALHLSRPFCEDHQLTNAVKTIQGGFAAGVGGETKQRIGRVSELRLGQVVLKDVITGFSEDQKGAGASRDASGIIGGDVLRRFTVIFDYSRNEMILEPNASLEEPFEYDMCGAFLRTTEDYAAIEVHRLVEESPAIAAGLKQGDRITSIDGQPVGKLSLEEVRTLFREPGRTVKIGYEREGAKAETKLTTKRMI